MKKRKGRRMRSFYPLDAISERTSAATLQGGALLRDAVQRRQPESSTPRHEFASR